MSTIWGAIQTYSSERPKYTRFELGHLMKKKREELGLTVEEVATKYQVHVPFLESIETASRAFDVKTYKLIGDFLCMSKDHLLAKETDDLFPVSYRTIDKKNTDIVEVV